MKMTELATTGKLELRTVDGEWPEWATVDYPADATEVLFEFPADAPVGQAAFDAARFIAPDGSRITHEFAPIHLLNVPPHPGVRPGRLGPFLPWRVRAWVLRHPNLRWLVGTPCIHPGSGDTILFNGWRDWNIVH